MLEISMDLVRQLKSDITGKKIEELHITLLLLTMLKSAAMGARYLPKNQMITT